MNAFSKMAKWMAIQPLLRTRTPNIEVTATKTVLSINWPDLRCDTRHSGTICFISSRHKIPSETALQIVSLATVCMVDCVVVRFSAK